MTALQMLAEYGQSPWLDALSRALLRAVARTLGQVTMGVRAIEKQTEPLGPALGEVNQALDRTVAALGKRGEPTGR